MRNPFGSESSAYHFLFLTVAAFGVVAIASAAGGALVALVVWVIVSAGAFVFYARGHERSRPEAVEPGPPEERRIVVVAPLEASPLHRLANDVDPELRAAHERAEAVVATLGAPHVRVTTAVGDDAVAAVGDALRTYGGDHVFVLPGDDTLVQRLRRHYAVPVDEVEV